MERVWRTTDGQIFDELDEAEAYESKDFERWFKEQPQLVKICETLSDDGKDEIYGTDRGIFKSIIGDYYKEHVYKQ